MIKRFFLALAISTGLLSPVYSAGTIPFSLSQQLDQFGKPLAGCQFFTIVAGTTSTPQNVFQDSALTLPLPNPQTCDAAGRLPQFFAADGSIKVRLTDRNGVTVIVADNVQVIGNSSGGGGGSPVDPTTILTTGDIKVTYGTGTVTGFVRLNGRTIGSSTSGASERANADCQALFVYLWGADPNLTVSTGRGASAAADWTANKQLSLPDSRGLVLAGLDDMGNSSRGIFAGVTFSNGNATTLGSALGAARRTLTAAQLPANIPNSAVTTFSQAVNAPTTTGVPAPGSQTVFTPTGTSVTATTTVTINPGGGSAFDAISPTILTTIYIKL